MGFFIFISLRGLFYKYGMAFSILIFPARGFMRNKTELAKRKKPLHLYFCIYEANKFVFTKFIDYLLNK